MNTATAPAILVLDDDITFVEVLGRALRKRGHTVLQAHTIESALTQATAAPPEFAVVDMKISQESGLDCIAPLLALNPLMRILILTGYSSVATAVAAIKIGAFDYACKPLDADEILLKLGLGQAPGSTTPLPAAPLSVDRLEWEHIQRVLSENDGNISATARSLGMHRRTLQRKLQKRPVRQ
jgi:two-component system, response regulator RegA